MGTGAGNAEKDSSHQAIEGGRVGRRAGGLCFSGARPPSNELYLPQTISNPVKVDMEEFSCITTTPKT